MWPMVLLHVIDNLDHPEEVSVQPWIGMSGPPFA